MRTEAILMTVILLILFSVSRCHSWSAFQKLAVKADVPLPGEGITRVVTTARTNLAVAWEGSTNCHYLVQSSDDLVTWLTVLDLPETQTAFPLLGPLAGTQRFFRVGVAPLGSTIPVAPATTLRISDFIMPTNRVPEMHLDFGAAGSFHVEQSDGLQSRPAKPANAARLRLSSATPNAGDNGSQHFLVYPYDWGTAIELSGTNGMGQRTGGQIEIYANQLSVQSVQGGGNMAQVPRLQIGNNEDQAGLITEVHGMFDGNYADIAYRPYGLAGCPGDLHLRIESETNIVQIMCGGGAMGPARPVVTFTADGCAAYSGKLTAGSIESAEGVSGEFGATNVFVIHSGIVVGVK